ncbi:MAG: hypothetical protein LKE51_10220 [Selenomonas sp.]|jgi:hypothetical protein|nr:hypothetical protein [Selenomonas sp.]
MKKRTAAVLAVAMLLSAGGYRTGFAAENFNPYADVPEGNWAYDAVDRLIHDGYVNTSDSQSYQKGKIMVRHDFAVITADALSRKSTMRDADKQLVDKLAAEYEKELRLAGVESKAFGNVGTYNKTLAVPADAAVTVPPAEADKMGPTPYNMKPPYKAMGWNDKFKIYGVGRLRFDRASTDGTTYFRGTEKGNYTPTNQVNFNIWTQYDFSDSGWFARTESEFCYNYNNGGRGWLQDTMFLSAFAEGPLTSDRHLWARTGRYVLYTPQGIVFDSKITAARLVYLNKGLGITVDVGKANENTDGDNTSADGFQKDLDTGKVFQHYRSQDLQNVMLDARIGHTTDLHTSFTHVGGKLWHSQDPDYNVSYLTVGFDTRFTPRLRLATAVTQSNAVGITNVNVAEPVRSTLRTAWMARLMYGPGANYDCPGSFDSYLVYRRQPRLATYNDTDDWFCNTEGWRIGGIYSLGHRMWLTGYYSRGRDIDTHKSVMNSRIQLEFFY